MNVTKWCTTTRGWDYCSPEVGKDHHSDRCNNGTYCDRNGTVTTGVQWETLGATPASKERAKRSPPMATNASPSANTTTAVTTSGATNIIVVGTTVHQRTG